MPYSDIGNHMNYNGPKVGIASSRQEAAAPLMGDHEVRSRLFAGNTENPAVLAHECQTFLVGSTSWTVTIRPVRSISRKGSSPTTSWWVSWTARAASAVRSSVSAR